MVAEDTINISLNDIKAKLHVSGRVRWRKLSVDGGRKGGVQTMIKDYSR